MQVLYARCAGLDVHKKTVVGCRMLTGPDGTVTKETRTCGTTTAAFGPPRRFGVSGNPKYIAVGDFNGDKALDLATADSLADTVSILLGNGDGTFTYADSLRVGRNPSSIAVADFNGDGIQDLAVANSDAISILLGHGDGTFTPARNVFDGEYSMTVGDFNGDKIPDLALAYVAAVFPSRGLRAA